MAEDEGESSLTSPKMLFLDFIILLGLLALFIWLGIRPKPPSYTMTAFSVENSSISFSIEIENSNKESEIYYGNVNFTCYDNQQLLGYKSFESFPQDKEEKTPLSGTIVVTDKVWKALKAEIAQNKAQIHVKLVTKIRYRTWGIKSPRKNVHQKAELPIGSNGKIAGKTKLKWRIKLT